ASRGDGGARGTGDRAAEDAAPNETGPIRGGVGSGSDPNRERGAPKNPPRRPCAVPYDSFARDRGSAHSQPSTSRTGEHLLFSFLPPHPGGEFTWTYRKRGAVPVALAAMNRDAA